MCTKHGFLPVSLASFQAWLPAGLSTAQPGPGASHTRGPQLPWGGSSLPSACLSDACYSHLHGHTSSLPLHPVCPWCGEAERSQKDLFCSEVWTVSLLKAVCLTTFSLELVPSYGLLIWFSSVRLTGRKCPNLRHKGKEGLEAHLLAHTTPPPKLGVRFKKLTRQIWWPPAFSQGTLPRSRASTGLLSR